MFQDGGECLEKAARAVRNVKILDVVAHRKTLPADNVRLLGRGERLRPFFRTQRLHSASVPAMPVCFSSLRPMPPPAV